MCNYSLCKKSSSDQIKQRTLFAHYELTVIIWSFSSMASDSVQTWLSLFPFLVSVLSFLSDYLKAVNYCLQNYKKDCHSTRVYMTSTLKRLCFQSNHLLINSQSTTETDICLSRRTQARPFCRPQEPYTDPETVGLEASLTAPNLL